MYRYAVLIPLALAACGTTPDQRAAIATGATTLLQVAATNNTTVAGLLARGALICGQAASADGQLALGGLVVIANAAGAPASVTGMASGAVADACDAVGKIAGPLPAGADPSAVGVAVVPTVLPAVVVAAK